MNANTDLALAAMVDCLRPDRALVLRGSTSRDLRVEGAHGLPAKGALESGFVSLTVFSKVINSAESLWTADARQHPELKDSFSLQMSEIRSIVSTPIFHPQTGVWGMLYADRKADSSSYKLDDLKWLLLCARRLEDSLFEGKTFDNEQLRRSGVAPKPAARPAMQRATPQVETVTDHGVRLRPSPRSVTMFLRSISVMLRCGVPLAETFAVLSSNEEDDAMREVLDLMCARVLAGRPLSKSMQSFPRAFSSYQVSVVRAGETSGRLPEVLEMLSLLAEKHHALSMRIRSALTYPLAVLVFCLGGAVLVPPFLFRGHLEALQASGMPLPILTRALIAFSDALQHPIVWILMLAATVAMVVYGRHLNERPQWRARLTSALLSAPVLGAVLQQAVSSRFARTLALGIRSGLSAVPALEQAAEVAEDPGIRSEELRESLLSGGSIASALRQTGRFDRMFLAMVESGEEAGRLEELLLWQANLAESEIEHSVDRFTSMLEPLVLLLVGIIVGLVLVATMLPTLQLLQGL